MTRRAAKINGIETRRVIINLPAYLSDQIVTYRFSGRFQTESAAVRDLLRRGLEAAAAQQDDDTSR